MHPHAFPDNKSGFEDQDGNMVEAGDQVIYMIDGRVAVLDEALHDGDAFVTFEEGYSATVKWRHLKKKG